MANKYKKFVATAATATLVASAIVPVASASEKFSDVSDSSEFAPYIYDLADEKVMTGDQGKFNPGKEVTRTAAVKTLGKWLVNVHNYEVPADYATKARFNDLPVDSKDQELVKYAALLKDLGIFTGNEAGNLSAANSLNREQMAKVVVEAFSVISGKTVTELVADFDSKLTDLDNVSASNVDYVKVFEKYGITTVDTFNPKGQVKRQHFAKFLSIAIGSEQLAKDIEALPAADLTKALAAVETAVAALPKAEEVTAENAEAATKAVEAVTTAVETATKALKGAEGLTEEETKAAEAKLAAATEAAKAVADKVAEVTAVVNVASVKGINATSMEVTLAKDFTEKEANLVGKQITLTAGEKTLVATYSEKSLDKEGKAIFTLATGEKLEDAVTYEASAKWAKFAANTFVAKTAEVQVKTFTKVTEAVPATKDVNGTTLEATAKIQLAAQDQYGEEISLTGVSLDVTGTINGKPLSGITATNGVVSITDELKEGDVVAFTVSTKKDNKVIAKNDFTYTVVKGEAAKISTLSLSAKDNKVELDAGSEIKVTVKALDQFKSTVDVQSSDLEWYVNGVKQTGVTDVLTISNATSKEYKIQAFSATDSKIKAEIVVTVGAAKLSTLTYNADAIKDVEGNAAVLKDAKGETVTTSATSFNNEELVLGTVNVNAGAQIKASDIQFNVVAPKGLAKEDIKVVAEEATTEAGKKVIVVKATTTKAGAFKVTPFVGTSFTADDVQKASEFTVTTTVNKKVDSIELANFDAKDLKVGEQPKTEVVIKNVHGEVLTASDVNGVVSVKTTDATVADGKIVQGNENIKGEDKNKTYLQLFTTDADSKAAGLTEGTAVLTVQAGAVVKAVQVDVVATSLKSVNVKDAKVTNVIAGDTEAKYNEIAFLDQDGKQISDVTSVNVKDADGKAAKANVEFTVKDAADKTATGLNVALGEMKVDENTGVVSFDAAGKDSHVQITTDATLAKGTYTVTATVTTDAAKKESVTTSFQVVVDAARTEDAVEISAVQSKVVMGTDATIRVTPKDQYGKVFATNNKTVTVNEKAVTVNAVTAGDLDKTLTGDAANEVVYYEGNIAAADLVKGDNKVTAVVTNAKGEKVATASTNVSVDTTAALVNTVAISEVKGAQNVTTDGVQLEAIVKDANNNKVAVDPSTLTWTIDAVTDSFGNKLTVTEANGEYTVALKDAKGELTGKTAVLTVTNGKLDTKTAGSLEDLFVDVNVKVETENFKSASTTVKIGDAAAKYTSGLKVAKVFNGVDAKADEVKFTGNGTDLVINDASKAITLTFTGVDQYGTEFVDFSDLAVANTTAVAQDLTTSVKTVDGVTYLTFTAVSVDGGQVYLNYKGEKITFNVTVDGKAKEALQ